MISGTVIDDAVEACKANIIGFKTVEYARLREHSDPAESLIQEMFGALCSRHGDTAAYQYMAGSLVVTRAVYVGAEQQGVEVQRPSVGLFRPHITRIIERLRPDVPMDIDDVHQQFPEQPDLCRAVQDFQFTASRVGALSTAALYVAQLVSPGHTVTLSLDGQPLTAGRPEEPTLA